MLQEAIDLQQNAVAELMAKIGTKRELTFRAPTGSGKTRMMADFMNRILSQNQDVIFLVSTLSKGNLAEQNYNSFKECADKNIYPMLKPHLISSEISGEESLFIPTDDYNVYVLPCDLYKAGGRLMQGAMLNFLEQVTANLFGVGLNKRIFFIKDECHRATNNIDAIAPNFFEKIINFTATPNLKRGQHPDVEITDEAAMNAKLVKHIEWGAEEDTVETAIRKFEQIKEDYRNLLNRNPCLIIQISNKDKAEEEWAIIESILNKTEHQHLKWMLIVNEEKKCRTNDDVGKLPVARWKDYAKNDATTDVIIFKLAISEGWDIPRACMLYQVRGTQSKQLDEQVMGRVRRNPRLTDFEKLTPEAQNLAMTAWIWGIEPKKGNNSRQVRLFGSESDIPQALKIKTTYLKQLTERKGFDIDKFINEKSKHDNLAPTSIFDLYAKLQKTENEVRDLCYDYADNYEKWWHFCEHIDAVRKEYDNFACNYEESMEIVKDADGNEREVSFPLTSMYVDNEHYQNISDWVWQRKDGNDKFSFDSEAEREWASFLKDISKDGKTYETEVGEPNPHYGQLRTDGTAEPQRLNAENKYLWGKNFIQNSEIKFEYYQNGIHASYPDFVLKDKKERIHIFEVKSVNASNAAQFDSDEYKSKVQALIDCYKQCSVLTGYYYYLPVLKNDNWIITRIVGGDNSIITKDEFKRSLNAE